MGCITSSAASGGYCVGEKVYYGGPSRKVSRAGHEELEFGAEGEVSAQTCRGDVIVAFAGHKKVCIRSMELSRKCPVIPDGYFLGERVFYGGPNRRYPNGDQLVFRAQGQIAGRSCVGDGMDGERVAVIFPDHRDAKAVRLALISRETPVIPGGYGVGDRVFWCGMDWKFPNGDRLRFGAEGEVAGRSCVGDGMDDERVAVNFPGNKGAVAMRLPEISSELPVIPGGYRVGDRVFYAYPNWRAPDGHMLMFGVQGKVIGRSCIGDGKDDERVWVLFPGLGYGCIHLEQISREPPIIPAGYSLGDRVYFCGPSRPAGCNGDRLTFGVQGEVAGRACRADVAVSFPGNEDAVDVRIPELSREPPVIPGGYNMSDTVFYCGNGWIGPNGDRVTFGAKGEVAGRSCQGDNLDEERVAVLLPGNRGSVLLQLQEIRKDPPPRLEERLGEQLKSSTVSGDVPGLAATHRTATGAGLHGVAEAALEAGIAQVTRAHLRNDVAELSRVQRAAEDAQWSQLVSRAGAILEEVALPHVLKAAKSSGDLFGLWAVAQRAKSRNLQAIASEATTAIDVTTAAHSAKVSWPGTPCGPPMGDLPLPWHSREECDGELVQLMQELADDTYTGWGGFGRRTRTRDRPSERVASRIEVVGVEHLRNPESYLNYSIRREVITAELAGQQPQDWEVKTEQGIRALFDRNPLQTELNEHFLWHGTGPVEAKSIAAHGFDLEQAGSARGALFGRGLYFAESCLKADEYVKSDEHGRFPLLLCRVTLGKVHYCDVEDPWDLHESLRASCRVGTGGYHSVLGDREKVRQTFREFVVFDSSQAYPEFIVWYTRK